MARVIFSNRYATESYHGGLIQGATPLELRLLDTVAFVVGNTEPNTDFDLAQAWSRDSGSSLLLGAPATDPIRLGQALLEAPWAQDAKLVWVANPNDPPADWIRAAFALDPASRRSRLRSRSTSRARRAATGCGSAGASR